MKAGKRISEKEIIKRLAAILVAVVFVFGTAVVPAEIFADEPEEQDAVVTEAVEEIAEPEEAPVTGPEEAAEPEAVEEDLTDLVMATDENGNGIDIEDLDEDAYNGFIYKMKDDTTKTEIKEMEKAIDELGKNQEAEELLDREYYTADSLETISEVAPAEQIEYIEPDYIRTISAVPNDEYYEDWGWFLEMVDAPYIWDKGKFGSGVTVAVLDTGAKTAHEDFASGTFVKPRNTTVTTTSTDVTDTVGHGTAVSGVIAAAYNNGKGITGVTPQAKIMPVKVFKGTSGQDSYIIKGIDYATENGADVINMSLGGEGKSTSLKAACDRAAASGVILVAAAGNEAYEGNPIEYPASYTSVISVGAVDEYKRHSSFSNYNKYVAVSAPGEDMVVPTLPYMYNGKTYNYDLYSGTSFASPMVAAMAALVKSIDKNVDRSDFLKIIKATSEDRGAAGKDDKFGHGIMNVGKACRYMTGDISFYDATLSADSFVFDGEQKLPAMTIKRLGTAIPASGYTTTYSVGCKQVGTYKVTATGKGSYTGTKSLTFKIVPPLVKKIKSPTRGKKQITVRWLAMNEEQLAQYENAITGYQVRVSKSSKFSSSKKVKITGIEKTKATVKGLKRNTVYYMQYRAYKTVGSTTYYSKWSGKKKTRTK